MARRSERPICIREGCTWRVVEGRTHCSALCNYLDVELGKAEDICKAVADSTVAMDLWGAVTTLNDALTEYRRVRSRANGVRKGKPA